jgi:myosin heavy subunit
MARYAPRVPSPHHHPPADNALQTKTVETTLLAIQTGNDPNLPPLMNPAMLEASDDLTNLSHLNEPAGMLSSCYKYAHQTC